MTKEEFIEQECRLCGTQRCYGEEYCGKYQRMVIEGKQEEATSEELILPTGCSSSIWIPKKVATIKLCGGALTFDIDDTMQWQRPTDEQIYNLKNLFCIEVIPED